VSANALPGSLSCEMCGVGGSGRDEDDGEDCDKVGGAGLDELGGDEAAVRVSPAGGVVVPGGPRGGAPGLLGDAGV
jgi:hypothetical protein